MSHTWTVPLVDETRLTRLAELISLKIGIHDTVALRGDLGAGKTTFARAMIRVMLDDEGAEVPSPTYAIVQTYDTPRLPLAHFDLYRLAGEEETAELGCDELRARGAVVIEWTERAPSLLGPDRLDISLIETPDASRRNVVLEGFGSWAPRLARLEAMAAFVGNTAGWQAARIRYFQGDASSRAYAKLTRNGEADGKATQATAILMDWPRQPDGPPIRGGLPYSRIAHIAEDVSSFAAVAGLLLDHGFRAPEVLAADLEHGFLLLEDLGDQVFGREIARGTPMLPMWQSGTDELVRLRRLPREALAELPVGFGSVALHRVPLYDAAALAIETELLLDWYWPMMTSSEAPAAAREAFGALWAPLFDIVLAHPPCLVLRDYHSPNLLVLGHREGEAPRAGLIDFQDAMRGHPAYDLVSLLQDARLDVPAEVEATLLQHYCAEAARGEPSFDEPELRQAYAILGAQRNTKILGIFARLAKRDGKRGYLAHIPRIWRYLERDLAHPRLAGLAAWYGAHFPPAMRAAVPQV